MMNALKPFLKQYPELVSLAEAVRQLRPLSYEEGMALYVRYPLEVVRLLADDRRKQFHQDQVFYNRNIHLEPTNKCAYSCKFCAFYRQPNALETEGAWDYTLEEMEHLLDKYEGQVLTEVHITGGVHPYRDLEWWAELIQRIKRKRPQIHVKAYTAVEIAYMARKSKKSLREVLRFLKAHGLDSLPGGGAEIFDPEIRKRIAGGKAPASQWIEVHQTAHELGISSNATMLYGHVESYEHRLKHMLCLREIQEQTQGFKAFIPLKYRNENNLLSHLAEVSEEEDLKNYAVSRLMLHNIRHLKAYWVMIGLDTAQKSLDYGVDDLDGTINETTRIYSMAGSLEKPAMSSEELKSLIRKRHRIPVERNSTYDPLQVG
ncbi:CofH family radical SAM protein [Deltaproteobacteria bacterium TL4]